MFSVTWELESHIFISESVKSWEITSFLLYQKPFMKECLGKILFFGRNVKNSATFPVNLEENQNMLQVYRKTINIVY